MSAVRVPGDKSIAHRAFLLAGLADGVSRLGDIPDGLDVASTRRALTALGVAFNDEADGSVTVQGRGGGFVQPAAAIDCGNSGTTMRLLSGVLATRRLAVTLDGDASLRSRPMKRVTEPLTRFGAQFTLSARGTAPIEIRGNERATGIDVSVEIASAQVKSALLFAALGAQGRTTLRGALATRDHTERLFDATGVPFTERDGELIVDGPATPRPLAFAIPGDFSSAAFLLAAAAAVPGASVTVEHVGLNPSRTAFLDVLRRFGAEVTTTLDAAEPEPIGRIEVRGAALRAVAIKPHEVPGLIDELPLVGVLGAFARGTTTVHGASELRVKESDRIERFAEAARALGAEVQTAHDGFAIRGPARLHGATIATGGDHRIAMAFSVLARVAGVHALLDDPACVAVSFPGFAEALGAVA